MELKVDGVKMQLGSGIVNVLAEIKHRSGELAANCKDNLDSDFASFANGVATYAAHAKRTELEDPRNRESFNVRLLNTQGFFTTSLRIHDSVVKAVAMRKKSMDMLAQTLLDGVMFVVAYVLEHVLQVALHKNNKAAIEKQVEELTQSYTRKSLEKFGAKVAPMLAEIGAKLARLEAELGPAVTALATATGKYEQHAAYLLKRLSDPRSLDRSPVAQWISSCLKDFDSMTRLAAKKTGLEQGILGCRKAADTLRAISSNLDQLRNAGDDMVQQWKSLFGPGTPGESMIRQAREELEAGLKQLEQTLASDMAGWEARIAAFPPEYHDMFRQCTQAAAQSSRRTEVLEGFNGAIIDLGKNVAGRMIEKLGKIQELEEKQKEQAAKAGFFARLWDTIWSNLAAVGSALAGWFSGAAGVIGYFVPNFVSGFLLKICQLFAAALVLFCQCIVNVLGVIAKWMADDKRFGRLLQSTYMVPAYRKAGQAVLEKNGVSADHFYGHGQKEVVQTLANQVTLSNIPAEAGNDRAAAGRYKQAAIENAKGKTAQMSEQHLAQYAAAVVRLAREALKPARMKPTDKAASRYEEANIGNGLNKLTQTMVHYDRQFQLCDAGFIEFAAKKLDECWSDQEWNWAVLVNQLGLIGSQGTLLIQIVAFVVLYTPLAPASAGIALIGVTADAATAALRTALCVWGVIPCVSALAGDFMAMQGIAFDAMITETVCVANAGEVGDNAVCIEASTATLEEGLAGIDQGIIHDVYNQ